MHTLKTHSSFILETRKKHSNKSKKVLSFTRKQFSKYVQKVVNFFYTLNLVFHITNKNVFSNLVKFSGLKNTPVIFLTYF